ncbi:MAG: alanyl-tRNA editing protein [Candidatus Aenigmarchaeota archaeon]|nr:alanyl-tRNA editing protein [Candidatus Aenigmarchaeota archaeon]MDI6721971.1 alanyl-tRNA editing protein [Candidatus Aenigmarchaeota archaeon]
MEYLYLTDSYLKEWDAVVETVNGNFITLDKSAFYPAGGGQLCDKGKVICNVNEYDVVNVTKKDGIEISRKGLSVGDRVHCIVDWDRRYKLMRMHTAAHILIAVMYKYGTLVTGNQLDVDKSRIDFSLEVMDRQKINECFDRANEIVKKNLPVSFEFMKRDDVMKIPHLMKLAAGLPDMEEFRILRIGEVSDVIDEQADGGTHVAGTNEIGNIKLLSIENKGKNNRRVYYTVE